MGHRGQSGEQSRADGRSRRRGVVVTVVAVLVALVPASAVHAIAPGAKSNGTGTSGYPGVGTPDALQNPACDAETGKVRIPIQGGRALPPCVRAWPENADNGGSTAPGVTADSIKVLFRIPPDFTDAQDETFRRMARDAFKMQDRLETWGRKWDLAFVKGTSNDEAGQRADAVEIALTHKPFAVINHLPTGVLPVFEAELARRNIVVFGWVSLWEDLQAFPGYRYTFSMDDRIRAMHIAEFVGKRLDGRRAEWAGDKSLKQKERVFGLVYPEGANLDIDFLNSQFARQGVKIAETQVYPADMERAQSQATLAVAADAVAGSHDGDLPDGVPLRRSRSPARPPGRTGSPNGSSPGSLRSTRRCCPGRWTRSSGSTPSASARWRPRSRARRTTTSRCTSGTSGTRQRTAPTSDPSTRRAST